MIQMRILLGFFVFVKGTMPTPYISQGKCFKII